jgi:hypothetical protein
VRAKAAAAAAAMPAIDDFRSAAVYSAAFDVTGEPRWYDRKKQFGAAATMRAEKLADRILVRDPAAPDEENPLLPLLRYWRMRRNAIFFN